jgi:hypothetical protein
MTSWMIAACLALAACGNKVGTPSAEKIPLGREFTLAVGQSAAVGDDVRLTLKSVTDDSRCPVDVTCVWEGDAKLSVEVITPTPRAEHELHTSAREGGGEAKHGAYRVTLVKLEPAPRSGRTISSSDYRATFVVVR